MTSGMEIYVASLDRLTREGCEREMPPSEVEARTQQLLDLYHELDEDEQKRVQAFLTARTLGLPKETTTCPDIRKTP